MNNRADTLVEVEVMKDRVASVEALEALVGHTPLLAIDYRFNGEPRRMFAKYEPANLTGSVKDRMALHILHQAYMHGELKPGDTIVECSSGNTGISFAAIGRALGHPVRIYMPNWMSQERVQLIHSYGAEVIPVSREQGGFVGGIDLARHWAETHENCFLPQQFHNPVNIEAHFRTTGPEIEAQLASRNLSPDAFVAGVGTGGTVMGVGRYLRQKNPSLRAHPLEPGNSPTLRTGHCVGKHRIQGISDELIPEILQLDELDYIVDAWDGDSILMAQMLGNVLGLGVGISSGANFIGAVQVQEELGPEAVVITIFCDCNKKYLSTDLCRREPVEDQFLTPKIELLRHEAIAMPNCGR